MRNRSDHQAAVARRLALLRAELGLPEPGGPVPEAQVVRADDVPAAASDPSGPESMVPGMAPSGAAPVPRPGRHASRRGPGLGQPGRFGPAHLALVAAAGAVALAVTCWLVVRADPHETVLSTPPASAVMEPVAVPSLDDFGVAATTDPTTAPTTAAVDVVVDVAGKVRRPGIAVLPVGARVVDAIEAAGGARPGVSLTTLNLARVLVDGEQIVVGAEGPATGTVASAAPGSPGAATAPVNLNTASLEELDQIPEVGPVTAQAILDWRGEHGGFSQVEELLEIDGIGPATLAKIAPHVTV